MTTIDIILHVVTLCALAAIAFVMWRREKRDVTVAVAVKNLSAARPFKDLSAEEQRAAIDARAAKFAPIARHVFGPTA
jgi:hypothetical protein